jgi:non-heme chloroperoxidase
MNVGQPVSRRLTLRNGIDLSYAEQGPADGTPVVLLHGYSDSWRSFASLMACAPLEEERACSTDNPHCAVAEPGNDRGPAHVAEVILH